MARKHNPGMWVQVPSYWLQSLGWTVYRINAKDLIKDLNTIITKVIDLVA